MLVVVQVFAWHIVFRSLVCDHLCHIWISRVLDTGYGIRFERIAFFSPAARPSFCDSLTAYKRDCTIGTLSRRPNMNLSARLRNRQTNLDPQPGSGKPVLTGA